jgi:hypothetical protein
VTVRVNEVDAALRRAVLNGQAGMRPRTVGRRWADEDQMPVVRRKAIVVSYGDGTYGMRLLAFDRDLLDAVKEAPDTPMTWDRQTGEWIVWSPEDRDLVIECLRSLGYRIARR